MVQRVPQTGWPKEFCPAARQANK